MNQDPNSTQTGGNTAFSQQSPGTQTNPFTGDLRGEFTSDFGTNTNAVSQIFKSSGFAGEDRNKIIMIAVAVLAIIGGFVYYMLSGSESEDPFANQPPGAPAGETAKEGGDEATGEEAGADGEKAPEAGAEAGTGAEAAPPAAATEAPTKTKAQSVPTAATAQTSGGAIAISAPADGATHSYDETQGPAVFQWEGAADRIVFARNSSMQPAVRVGNLAGKSTYAFTHPYPGTWFWRVENGSGQSEVRKFIVSAPGRRSFPVSAPAAGGTLAGTGGVVSWQAAQKVASYRVEMVPAGTSFANAPHRFGTSGTSVTLQSVPAGSYDLRVGAFSEVAGRWEWQVISGVTVQ